MSHTTQTILCCDLAITSMKMSKIPKGEKRNDRKGKGRNARTNKKLKERGMDVMEERK